MTYKRQHKSKRAIICSFLLQRLSWTERGGECWPVIRESTRMAMRRTISCLVLPRLLPHPHPPVHYTHRDLPVQTRHQPSTSRYRRNHIPNHNHTRERACVTKCNARVPPFPFYLQTINCFQENQSFSFYYICPTCTETPHPY